MNFIHYIYIALGVCFLFWIVIIILIARFHKKNKIAFEKRKNKLKNKTQNINANKEPQNQLNDLNNIALNPELNNDNVVYQNDIPSQPVVPLSPKESNCLQHDINYVVGSKGSVREGKYIIVSADENFQTFDMQLGDYVKSYNNGDTIVLKIGESVKPLTCSINLLSF